MAEHVKKRKKMEILGKFNTQIKTQIVAKKLVAITSNLSTSLKERNSLIQRYLLAKFVLESSMFIAKAFTEHSSYKRDYIIFLSVDPIFLYLKKKKV